MRRLLSLVAFGLIAASPRVSLAKSCPDPLVNEITPGVAIATDEGFLASYRVSYAGTGEWAVRLVSLDPNGVPRGAPVTRVQGSREVRLGW